MKNSNTPERPDMDKLIADLENARQYFMNPINVVSEIMRLGGKHDLPFADHKEASGHLCSMITAELEEIRCIRAMMKGNITRGPRSSERRLFRAAIREFYLRIPGFIRYMNTMCSVCGEKQYLTESGTTCRNGHVGAPSKPGRVKQTKDPNWDFEPQKHYVGWDVGFGKDRTSYHVFDWFNQGQRRR